MGWGPSAAGTRGSLVHLGALVQRGAKGGCSRVQRWARRWEPWIYGLWPGRFGAPVAVQRGEKLGAGGRAGVVRKGRQAKQALAETGQVAAGERLGVLAWGPGSPRGLHPASLPQVAHGELQNLRFLQLRVPEVLQTEGGGAQRQKGVGREGESGWGKKGGADTGAAGAPMTRNRMWR